MNEVEKLYSLAGCKKIFCDCTKCKKTDCIWGDMDQDTCVTLTYSPFTAEKQIELIKWLARKDCMYRLTYERDFLWCSQLEWQSSFCYESFEESLANLINTIWQYLTKEERQQIKEILE